MRFRNRKCEIYAASRAKLLLRARTLITDLAGKFRKASLPKWGQVHNLSWEWKIISMSMAEHLTSFWYRGPGELGNGRLSHSCFQQRRKDLEEALADVVQSLELCKSNMVTSLRVGRVLLRILDGGYATRLSKFWPYFRPKNVISLTRFQTWPPRNYVITLRLEHQQKRFLNSPISLSFLLICNWKDKYVHTFP